MNKNIKDLLIEIKDLAKFNENYAMCTYKLGVIKGLCEEYLETHADIEEELVNDVLPVTSRVVPPDEPISPITFEEYCKKETDKIIDGSYITALLERNGSKMNLNFEISKRFHNKDYAKHVRDILNRNKIVTMSDFLLRFDDPEFYSYFLYPNSKYANKKFNNKYNFSGLKDSDREILVGLYMTANEFQLKDAEQILRDFYSIKDSKMRETRFINAFKRSASVHTINQLYIFLKENKIEDVRKMKGLSNLPDSIIKLYDEIHKEDK